MPCPRCCAVTKTGARCRKTTCKWNRYCIMHLKYFGCGVTKSSIPGAGLGLVALREWVPGELMPYNGEVLTRAQRYERYPGDPGPYVLQVERYNRSRRPVLYFIDAQDPEQNNFTRYINDYRGSGKPPNCEFDGTVLEPGEPIEGRIVVTRPVHPHQEFLISYGDEYWKPGELRKMMRLHLERGGEGCQTGIKRGRPQTAIKRGRPPQTAVKRGVPCCKLPKRKRLLDRYNPRVRAGALFRGRRAGPPHAPRRRITPVSVPVEPLPPADPFAHLDERIQRRRARAQRDAETWWRYTDADKARMDAEIEAYYRQHGRLPPHILREIREEGHDFMFK